jgi:hypothetical protein
MADALSGRHTARFRLAHEHLARIRERARAAASPNGLIEHYTHCYTHCYTQSRICVRSLYDEWSVRYGSTVHVIPKY